MNNQEGGVPIYVLLKDMPGLKTGAIFEHREYDDRHPDRGNPSNGAMLLAWIQGNCQQSWCGEAFTLPGQLADDKEWFQRVTYDYGTCKGHWHVNGSTFVSYEDNES